MDVVVVVVVVVDDVSIDHLWIFFRVCLFFFSVISSSKSARLVISRARPNGSQPDGPFVFFFYYYHYPHCDDDHDFYYYHYRRFFLRIRHQLNKRNR